MEGIIGCHLTFLTHTTDGIPSSETIPLMYMIGHLPITFRSSVDIQCFIYIKKYIYNNESQALPYTSYTNVNLLFVLVSSDEPTNE